MQSDGRFSELAAELSRRFDAGARAPWTEDDFTALALEAFGLQYDRIDAYRGLCDGRGLTPSTVFRWQDVPAVPATAFKHLDLAVVPATEAEAVFLTSGTTRGPERRGRHVVASVELYRRSLLPPFRDLLLDGARMTFLSLVPTWAGRPESSLSCMVTSAAEALATDVRWLVGADGSVDEPSLRAALRDAASRGEPTLVLGTALALLHVTEMLEKEPCRLPPGSRVMETGGFKGFGREISREALRARIEMALGVPSSAIVGEYGMTELLSQLYEPVLAEGRSAAGTYVAPPWLRVRALDPTTLEEKPDGDPGILAFFDLANVGSVCHVLTEDWGTISGDRVRLHGRRAGSEPRGCSVAMDEIISAARATAPAAGGVGGATGGTA